MKAPKKSGDGFSKHPPGYAVLLCTRIIDIGTHWNEKRKAFQRKIMLGFESNKLIEDEGEFQGKPYLIYASFTFSMYQNAHLCKFIQDWRGKRFANQTEADDFDLSKLLTQSGYAHIVHSDDGQYANISTMGPLPDGTKAPELVGELIVIDQDNLDMKQVEKLSDTLKQRVLSAQEQQDTPKASSQQYNELNPPQMTEDDFDDDIPF